MTRILLAALALACAGSPAMAGSLGAGDTSTLYSYSVPAAWIFGLASTALIIGAHFRSRVPPPDAKIWLIPLAFMMTMLFGPAIAAEAREVGSTAVIVPWGDYLVATAQMAVQIMLPVILPIVAAYAIQALRKVYPWASLFLTQARLEQMAVALAEYGLNAVSGAAKGKTLSVSVGSSVVAAGLNRALETVPQAVIDKAGGPEGVAKLIFRKLDLEEAASEATVLIPALNKVGVPAR